MEKMTGVLVEGSWMMSTKLTSFKQREKIRKASLSEMSLGMFLILRMVYEGDDATDEEEGGKGSGLFREILLSEFESSSVDLFNA